MVLPGNSIQTESYIGDGLAMCHNGGPDSIEVPTVCDKAHHQSIFFDDLKHPRELRMKSWLPACVYDVRYTDYLASLRNYSLQEFRRKKICRRVIESVFVSQTIAAVKIADIGQFDRQSTRTEFTP
jgi:hypothetical protein